jgi:hypothetical protein
VCSELTNQRLACQVYVCKQSTKIRVLAISKPLTNNVLA